MGPLESAAGSLGAQVRAHADAKHEILKGFRV